MFTRQGLCPGVTFPRILGIKAVGLLEEAPGNQFTKGEVVVSAMGGMRRTLTGPTPNTLAFPLARCKP